MEFPKLPEKYRKLVNSVCGMKTSQTKFNASEYYKIRHTVTEGYRTKNIHFIIFVAKVNDYHNLKSSYAEFDYDILSVDRGIYHVPVIENNNIIILESYGVIEQAKKIIPEEFI